MNILVTGGAGFIGSNFIRFYLTRDRKDVIVNYDALTYAGDLENLRDVEEQFASQYSFIRGDICNADMVESVIRDNDIHGIINFAAESHVDRSIVGARAFTRTNIEGVQVLLDLALKYKLVFMQISTDEVYGPALNGVSYTEEDMLNPSSTYAASKAAADLLVRAMCHTHAGKMKALITRSVNNFGPYQHPEKFIPRMIVNALRNQRLPIYGDGAQIRDWMHVEDNCMQLYHLWQGRRNTNGDIYNIGHEMKGYTELRNIDIAFAILDILGKPYSLIEHVPDRLGHDRRYAVSPKKLHDWAPYRPQVDFMVGLKQTIEWYTKNERWWKNKLVV